MTVTTYITTLLVYLIDTLVQARDRLHDDAAIPLGAFCSARLLLHGFYLQSPV